MLRNLGGAIGTAVLATVLTRREQFHSNIIGQSVTLYREEVRQRIAELTNYFLAHGISDPATAKHQAIVAIGKAVKRQALIIGFSDTFAVIGAVLFLSAGTLHWVSAWAYLVVMIGLGLVSGLLLARHDPALVSPAATQKSWPTVAMMRTVFAAQM